MRNRRLSTTQYSDILEEEKEAYRRFLDEKDRRAEKEREMKPYKIAVAVHWLGKFRLKRQGLLSYVNPVIYKEQHCKDIIDHSTDEEIRVLGLDVEEARSLARGGPDDTTGNR